MIMIKKMKWGVIMLLAILVYGCYPKSADSLNDTDLVYTNYDDTFNFTSDKTYYLSPEVVYIDTTATPNVQVNQWITSEVKNQFAAIGWTEVEDSTQANMVVLTSVLTVDIQSVTYWPGYGGWYGGWWGGWGYPGYGYPGGYYPVYTSYSIGSIFIDGFNASALDPSNDMMPPIVWSAALNGVLGTQISSASQTRIRSLIDQAFVQSPYLN
jgi:hypothetical protein